MPKLSFRGHDAIKNWRHHFKQFHIPALDVYAAIERNIQELGIPDVTCSRIKAFEHGIFSAQREYLSVDCKNYKFHICSAPFGIDSYVSWWLRVKDESLLRQGYAKLLPSLAKYRSYYHLDTEHLLIECIHEAIINAIDEISTQKGIRRLTEQERRLVIQPNLS